MTTFNDFRLDLVKIVVTLDSELLPKIFPSAGVEF